MALSSNWKSSTEAPANHKATSKYQFEILHEHTCEQSFGFLDTKVPMQVVSHILSNVDFVDQNNFHSFEDIRVKILFRKVP